MKVKILKVKDREEAEKKCPKGWRLIKFWELVKLIQEKKVKLDKYTDYICKEDENYSVLWLGSLGNGSGLNGGDGNLNYYLRVRGVYVK